MTALDHRPGTPAREELTWTTDQAVRPALESLVTDLGPVAADFDALAAHGRTAIAALAAADSNAIDGNIAAGQVLVEKITAETAALRERIATFPGTGPGQETRLGAAVLARIVMVGRTLDTTQGIAQAWAALSIGGATASRLALLLSLHDDATAEAVHQGSQGNFAAAVGQLDIADPLLVQAQTLRTQLSNTADVSTLSEWLDRNAVIDAALRRLYTILVTSGGTVTDDARKAYDAVRLAQRQLPPDTRALVVIMADLAQAGLNGAVIRIEEARGLLAAAMTALAAADDGRPEPGPSGAAPTEAQPTATPGLPATIGPPSTARPSPSAGTFSPAFAPPSAASVPPSAASSAAPSVPEPSITPPDA